MKFEDLNWYDENFCLEAVKKNGENLQFVEIMTDKIVLEAVKQNPLCIRHVLNPSKEALLEVIKKNPIYRCNLSLNERTREMDIESVKQKPYEISRVLDEYLEECAEIAIEKDIFSLHFVRDFELFKKILISKEFIQRLEEHK